MRRRIFLAAIKLLSEGVRRPPAHVVVKVLFNTDEHNLWVYNPETPLEGLPKCIFGPFRDFNAAMLWMNNAFVDDTDVHDMFADLISIPLKSLNDPIAALPYS